MEIRKATQHDIQSLMVLRKQQLVDEGITPCQDIDEDLERYFKDVFARDAIIEYLVEDQGAIIATAAIVFYDFPPTYTNKTGRKGYITNMYTHPDYRHQGIATRLVKDLMQEARQRYVHKLFLGASLLGRPVYEALGFHESQEWMEMDV